MYSSNREKAMIYFAILRKQNSQLLSTSIILLQIHQHFQDILTIQPDFLIIPQANYRESVQLSNTQKILLQGTIFQKLTNQKLQELYNNSIIGKEVDKNKHYILVMLSGDAPDEQSMRYFTKDSADMLLIRLAYLLGKLSSQGKQSIVIVQNGPRTGKHDPLTGKQVCLHKFSHGENPSIAVDAISSYFIWKLTLFGIKHYFYNFTFQMFQEKRVVNSFYKPLLHVAQQQGNIFLFPMQSVSMCSQLPYYIKPTNLYAYNTSSTNQSHMKVVQNGFKRGLYKMFPKDQLAIITPINQVEQKYDQTEKVFLGIEEKIIKELSQKKSSMSEPI